MADKRQNPSAAPPAAQAALRSGQALSAAIGGTLSDPFRLVLTIAVNLAIVAGIRRHGRHSPQPQAAAQTGDREAALSALDRGNTDEARSLAQRLAAKRDITNEEYGVPDFIIGALAAKSADAAGSKKRSEAYRQAALYLQRSRERGFPAHRAGEPGFTCWARAFASAAVWTMPCPCWKRPCATRPATSRSCAAC